MQMHYTVCRCCVERGIWAALVKSDILTFGDLRECNVYPSVIKVWVLEALCETHVLEH